MSASQFPNGIRLASRNAFRSELSRPPATAIPDAVAFGGWPPDGIEVQRTSLVRRPPNGMRPVAFNDEQYDEEMSELRALVEEHRREINELVRRHHGHAVSIFGSVARGEDTQSSDIDFLVEFDPGSSLFDLMDLEEALQSLLGVPVDVVSTGGLKERDSHIRREAIPI